MKPSNTLTVLACLIAVLALVAAGAGAFYQGEGASYHFTSLRGETVAIQGHGLYRFDSVSAASQAIAQDVVTLVVGLPLLLIALWLYRQGSLRGQLLLAGTLAYFLYTYTGLAFGVSFNPFFLVYVALFSLSLFAFISALVSVDLRSLPAHFSARLPRRAIAVFMFVCAGLLLFMWLGRLGPALLSGAAPFGLDANTTLFIQVMDLGLLVPLMVLAGVQLLKQRPLGYLLASVALIKFVTLGTALIAMIVGELLAGVAVSSVEAAIFVLMVGASLTMAAILWRNVSEARLV
jgi:hypothetical protein